jgi:hypothetical protein
MHRKDPGIDENKTGGITSNKIDNKLGEILVRNIQPKMSEIKTNSARKLGYGVDETKVAETNALLERLAPTE